ncbi:MAG: hypothetical protein HC830_04530 [Bacteroidetes bacterium]|nr:hypothetical protein [Bacteroidota bacterium]
MKGEIRLFITGLLLIGITIPMKSQDTVPRMVLTFDQALGLTLQNNHVIKQTQYLKEEKFSNSQGNKSVVSS